MNRSPKLSSLALAALVFCLAFAGCKSPKDRREERARQEADQRTDDARVRAVQDDDKRVSAARDEYRNRLRVFEGIAGSYEGDYSARLGSQVIVSVRLEVSDAPAHAVIVAAHREGELLAYRDQLGLNVTIEEFTATGLRPFSCVVNGVRPDFGKGLLRVSCPLGGSSSSPRNYVFGFDLHENNLAAASPTEMGELAQAVSENLVTGRQNVLEALSFTISARPTDISGRLERNR